MGNFLDKLYFVGGEKESPEEKKKKKKLKLSYQSIASPPVRTDGEVGGELNFFDTF